MRKAMVAVAAIPAIAGIYVTFLRRHRPRAVRVALGTLVLAVLAVVAYEIGAPPSTTAYRTPPQDPAAVARVASPIVADVGLHQAVQLDFSVPMDRASVAAAITVQPPVAVTLNWNAAGTSVAVLPQASWAVGTFYTVAIGPGARAAAGQQLATTTRAIILTRSAPSATIAATRMTGKRAAPATGFQLVFSRPIDPTGLRSAFRITPAVAGSLTADEPGRTDRFTFHPLAPLSANTVYVVTLDGPVSDTGGIALETSPRLVIRTLDQASVVRFRPLAHGQNVDPAAPVSVRFSRPMDRASTEAAFRLSGVDVKHGGTFTWAEGDTVLVFQPAKPLDYARVYVVVVGSGARSRDGVPLALPAGAADVRSAFRVAPKPAPVQAPTQATASTAATSRSTAAPAPAPKAPPPPPGAPWGSIESFALQLLNCTRTGGWVQSDGSCDGYGSGRYSAYVAPLTLSADISAKVTRPYAKLLADNRVCSHFYDGNPGARLARGGFTSYRWAENIGCQSGGARQVAINTVLFFQSEKSYAGGHWVNLKNAAYSDVGIGVWDAGGYVLVVYDFYHP